MLTQPIFSRPQCDNTAVADADCDISDLQPLTPSDHLAVVVVFSLCLAAWMGIVALVLRLVD